MVCIPCLQSIDSFVSAESYDDDIEEWAYSTWSDEYGQYDVYSSFSAGYWAGIWDSHTRTYIYDFKLGAIAASTGGGWSFGDDGVIMATAFAIDVTENGDAATFSVLDTPEYVWSTPEADEQSNNLYLVSTLLMDLVMTAVTNVGVSLAWTSVSFLIDAFVNAVDEASLQPNHIWRLWEWDKNLDECAQHMMFRVNVDPNEVVTIRTSYNVFGYPFELMQPIPIHFELEAPPAPSDTSSTMFSDSNPNENVIEISRDQLKEVASRGLITEATAERLLSYDDDTFYIAINTVDMIVDGDDSVQSVDFIEYSNVDYILHEIDRSEMIAHVFDRQDGNDANNVVEKHIQKLDELNKALDLVQSADYLNPESSFLDRHELSL